MRVAWVALLISGCVAPMRTIERFQSQRVAFSTMPVAPLAVSGSPGMSLAARMLVGQPQPQASGGGVAFPALQPELGGLVQLNERTWLGGRFNLALGAFGASQPASGARVDEDAVAFDLGVGAGHDLRVQQNWGFTFSGELGLSGTSVKSSSQLGTSIHEDVWPMGSAALGVWGTPGAVRLFLVGSVSSTPWNDPVSTITRDCFETCTISDDGVFALTAVGMIGAGARWQVNPAFSLALELWVPFTREGTQLPPMLTLTLRAGDFVKRPPPLSAPPPPPQVEPDPVETAPQI